MLIPGISLLFVHLSLGQIGGGPTPALPSWTGEWYYINKGVDLQWSTPAYNCGTGSSITYDMCPITNITSYTLTGNCLGNGFCEITFVEGSGTFTISPVQTVTIPEDMCLTEMNIQVNSTSNPSWPTGCPGGTCPSGGPFTPTGYTLNPIFHNCMM